MQIYILPILSKVIDGGSAFKSGLLVNDVINEMNAISTKELLLTQAQDILKTAGTEIPLNITRYVLNTNINV